MAAIFPGAVATQLQLLTAINNTKVLLDVNAGIGDTTITVDDASPLPTSGYLTFNDNADSPETIHYTGKSTNDLTGVTRGADGTSASAHTADGVNALEQRWNADYHNILTLEFVAVETYLSDRFGIGSSPVIPSGKTLTIAATSNQLVLGTTRTVTVTAPTPASASRTWTIPDLSGDMTFAAIGGAQTITGAKTFTSSTLLLQEAAGSDVVTIAVASLGSGRTYTVPDAGGAAEFVMTGGAQIVTGAKTFASSALLLQEAGSTDVVTIAVAALAAGRTYTVPDAGGVADFVMTAGAQTIGGVKTLSSAPIISALTASTVPYLDGSKQLASSAITPTQLGYLANIFGYRRPVLQFISVTAVDVENNTGISNQTRIVFPDGEFRDVTEDTASTNKYRRFLITAAAEFTSGTEDSGVRSGISEATNTWYAIYAVKSVINAVNFVLAGDTTLPLQANFSTLNSRYGTNGWVYLGMIRNGDGAGSTGDILDFVQHGNRVMFRNTNADANFGGAHCGLILATSAGTTSLGWVYAAGTGTAQVPNNILMGDAFFGRDTGTTEITFFATGTRTLYRHQNGTSGRIGVSIFTSLSAGVSVGSGASNPMIIELQGWVDNALGIGFNPVL